MTFAPVFQRPFAATFDRRAAAAAAGNGLLNNLVAYWPGNEAGGANDMLDLHTNGLTLTQVSSPGADTGKVYATARTFAQPNDYVTRASETLLQTGDVDFTVSAWLYLTADQAFAIAAGKRAASNNEWEMTYYQAGGNVMAFAVSANGTTWATDSVTSAQVLALNTWTLCTCWHDAENNQLGIQMNGNAASTKTYSSGVYAGSGAFQIASDVLSSTAYRWTGRIGPAMMWKSAAGGGAILSAAQRLALYNGGAGLAYANFTT